MSRIRKGRFLFHPFEGACGHGSAGDAVACGIGRRSTKRRALVIALGAQAIGVPLTARAQPQTAKPARVAWLLAASPETGEHLVGVFTRRMREMGYVEGKDVMYELRWARGKAERFAELAQELVALRPDVILATGGVATVRAAQQATRSIPIVAINMSDPVAAGLAKSLARPGGNVTGLSDLGYDAAPKRLELLLAAVPKLNRVAVLWLAADPRPTLLKTLQAGAKTLGVNVVAMEVASTADIEAAFARMARENVGGVVPTGTALAFAQMREIADLALRYRMPTIFGFRAAVEAGALMSYGVDLADVFRRAAVYVDKILKGANPADLPIEQAVELELVINLRTATAIGITIPQSVLLRAGEIIR